MKTSLKCKKRLQKSLLTPFLMRFDTKTAPKVNLSRSIYAAKPDIVEVLESLTRRLEAEINAVEGCMKW
ncbi:hypothetical protein COE25_09995 [Bacillus sp. AFS031507]|nr:hypothetical protein COE25_09995 [Bacillus sp. AFS031507]